MNSLVYGFKNMKFTMASKDAHLTTGNSGHKIWRDKSSSPKNKYNIPSITLLRSYQC